MPHGNSAYINNANMWKQSLVANTMSYNATSYFPYNYQWEMPEAYSDIAGGAVGSPGEAGACRLVPIINDAQNIFLLWTGINGKTSITNRHSTLRYTFSEKARDVSSIALPLDQGTQTLDNQYPWDVSCNIRLIDVDPASGGFSTPRIGEGCSMAVDGSQVFIAFSDWSQSPYRLWFGYTPDGTRRDISGGTFTFSLVASIPGQKIGWSAIAIGEGARSGEVHLLWKIEDDLDIKYSFCEDGTLPAPVWDYGAWPRSINMTGIYNDIVIDGSQVFLCSGNNETDPSLNTLSFAYNDGTTGDFTITNIGNVLPGPNSSGKGSQMVINRISATEHQGYISYWKLVDGSGKLMYAYNTNIDASSANWTESILDGSCNELWDTTSIAISKRHDGDSNPKVYITYNIGSDVTRGNSGYSSQYDGYSHNFAFTDYAHPFYDTSWNKSEISRWHYNPTLAEGYGGTGTNHNIPAGLCGRIANIIDDYVFIAHFRIPYTNANWTYDQAGLYFLWKKRPRTITTLAGYGEAGEGGQTI